MQKKKICALSLCIVFAFCIFICGCSPLPEQKISVYEGFSVHYLDVGQGDCIFIRLPDGKNMLIDTGINDEREDVIKYIKTYLNAYSVTKIDYLVLTHPDADHVGNAYGIIDSYKIGTAFIPFVSSAVMDTFPLYERAENKLKENGVQTVVSEIFRCVKGEGYAFAFLSPAPLGSSQSSYGDLNGAIVPEGSVVNNVSPIIYLQVENTRFLFAGDALKSQENYILDNYRSGLYSSFFNSLGISINLSGIDYLKIGHHGADNATGEDFLALLMPANAIISVGNENAYGHPSSTVQERLLNANPAYTLYRTDRFGTVVVHKKNGAMVVSAQG